MSRHEWVHPTKMKLGTVFWVWWANNKQGGFHRVNKVTGMGAATSEPVLP